MEIQGATGAVRAAGLERGEPVPTMARGDRRARRAVATLTVVVVILVVAAGLGLRILALGRAPVGSDQAVVGLMAHEILNGHYFAFYWGQNYGGAEPYVTAGLFALFGQSAFTLGCTSVLLDACAALLVWRVGRRIFPGPVGAGAALLFWIWPEVFVWQSTLEYGFRWAALDCGLLALLFALRLTADEETPRRRSVLPDALGLGAALGVGWWATPEIVYYVVPTALLLVAGVARGRLRLRPSLLGVFVLGAGAGALPWLFDNVGRGFPSLHAGPQQSPGFGLHLRLFVTHALPLTLGLRLPVSGDWLGGTAFGLVLYGAGGLAAVAWFAYLVSRRIALELCAFCVAAPLLYAASPFTWYWQDGRYALWLAPVASLLVVAAAAALVARLRPRMLAVELRLRLQRVAGPAVALAAGLGLTLGAVSQVAPFTPVALASSGRTGWLSWHADPNGWLQPAVVALARAGITHVYAGYWVAYALAFESGATVTASDVTSYARYRPYLDAVRSAPISAWVFVDPRHLRAAEFEVGTPLLDPGCIGGTREVAVPGAGTTGCLLPSELEAQLRRAHDPYRVLSAGDLLVIAPSHALPLDAVLAAAGIVA